jgi:hypothetical protein
MSSGSRAAGGGTLDRVRTVLALGPGNVARVGTYRLLLKAGLHPAQHLRAGPSPRGPFFAAAAAVRSLPAPSAWKGEARYFGWFEVPLAGAPPDWHRNPFDGRRAEHSDADWWRIPDFDPRTGDVKAIWEASRLDWAVNLAQHAAAGQSGSLERLNGWLADWCEKNPPYRGHNWKCAQEASIRVMHLAVAALVLGQASRPLPALVELLVRHLRRIEPTLSYARGQQNNHATSEAAALFVGGGLLAAAGVPGGEGWSEKGRRLLEELVPRLVLRDGSFSQYSLNYHRVMLDTLGICEVFRRQFGLLPFSDRLLGRAAAAARWLRLLVDPATGDAPNYGANDGANLLALTDAEYRDFRPATALGTALFEGCLAWPGNGFWQAHLAWLGVPPGAEPSPPQASTVFPDGGQAVLRSGRAMVLLVFPRYRFRPSHCDALHLDLWVDGQALLLDGGTFSYADPQGQQDDLGGARGHNTVQFDDRQQMPRLGRFLLGSWLRDARVTPISSAGDAVKIGAAITDAAKASHARTVTLGPRRLMVQDEVGGFRSRAVVRWRLGAGKWTIEGNRLTDGALNLTVAANVPIVRLELVDGWESSHYLRRSHVKVLEVAVASPGTVVTTLEWPSRGPAVPDDGIE